MMIENISRMEGVRLSTIMTIMITLLAFFSNCMGAIPGPKDPRYPDYIVYPKVVCEKEGVFPHPRNCSWYFRCVDRMNVGYFWTYHFECEPGTVFSDDLDQCVFPFLTGPPCGTAGVGSPLPFPTVTPIRPPQITSRPTTPTKLPVKPPTTTQRAPPSTITVATTTTEFISLITNAQPETLPQTESTVITTTPTTEKPTTTYIEVVTTETPTTPKQTTITESDIPTVTETSDPFPTTTPATVVYPETSPPIFTTEYPISEPVSTTVAQTVELPAETTQQPTTEVSTTDGGILSCSFRPEDCVTHAPCFPDTVTRTLCSGCYFRGIFVDASSALCGGEAGMLYDVDNGVCVTDPALNPNCFPTTTTEDIPTTTTTEPTTTTKIASVEVITDFNIICSYNNLRPSDPLLLNRYCNYYYLCEADGFYKGSVRLCDNYYQCYQENDEWKTELMSCGEGKLFSYDEDKCVNEPAAEEVCTFKIRKPSKLRKAALISRRP